MLAAAPISHAVMISLHYCCILYGCMLCCRTHHLMSSSAASVEQAGSCRDHHHCQESFGSLVAASCSVRPPHRKLAESTSLFQSIFAHADAQRDEAEWQLGCCLQKQKKTHGKQRYSNSSFSLTLPRDASECTHRYHRLSSGGGQPGDTQSYVTVVRSEVFRCMYVCVCDQFYCDEGSAHR